MQLRLILYLFLACSWLTAQERVDVLVFGGTPCGIGAAIGAAREGRSVLLVEPTGHLGGMVTSGLCHTDFRTFEGITGFYLTFSKAVESYYREKYGPTSEQVKQCWRGLQAEPHVNELIFERLLAEHVGIRVLKNTRLDSVGLSNDRISSVGVTVAEKTSTWVPRVAIDASYEGDLMAKAGVPFHVGREGKDKYNEGLAPTKEDAQLQAYNFRFIATDDPANRLAIQKPSGYQREDFVGALPFLKHGVIDKVFGYPSKCVIKAQLPPLPNRKYDLNDVSRGIIRMSMPGENLKWPEGGQSERAEIFSNHLRYGTGILYFLQHDEAVPQAMRTAALEFGWCKDEFTDNQHLPWQLYVREARRMIGMRVFTEHDSEAAPGDARAVLHRDSIAIGDYGNNCHGTAHEGPRYGGKHTGEFYKTVPPYQIPYGTIVPAKVRNLLVPGAPSSSHVGFCALRLEPIWGVMGEAAGVAASVVIQDDVSVQDAAVSRIQALLHEHGSATTYVSDIAPGHALFGAVQLLALRGGLHGLHPSPEKSGQRGKNIEGQYYEAFPGHAFQPELPLDEALFARWKSLMAESMIDTYRSGMKRGEAFQLSKPPRRRS